MTSLRSLSVMLALGLSLTVVPGCGPKEVEPEIVPDEMITDPSVFFKRGVTALQAESPDYQAAYDAFKQSINLDASNKKVQYNAGWTAQRLGKVDAAEAHYKTALQVDPTYLNALVNYTSLLSEQNRPGDAVPLYQAYIEAKPGDLDVRNSLVEALQGAERYDEAIAEAQAILLIDPDNAKAYRNLSNTYFGMGDYRMSLLCAEKAQTLKDGDAGIYNNMGVTYLKQGDIPSAIDSFKTAIKLDKDNIEANLNLGYVALDAGDFVQAKQNFETVVKARPENIDAQLGYAVALRGVKDYEGAAKAYDFVLSVEPGNEMAYFNSITLHEKYTKDFKKARKVVEDYKTAMQGQIGPDHPIFEIEARIAKSQKEEEERIAAEKERLKRAEELKKKQMEQLNGLRTRTAAYMKKVEQASCPAVAEMGMLEEFAMIGEQAQLVIDAEDFAMAGDMVTFLDSMEPTLDELIPMCGGAAPAPAPAEPAPAEPAPAEPAPAEGG